MHVKKKLSCLFPSCQVCTTCFNCGRRGFIQLNIFTSLYFKPTYICTQTLLSLTYIECQNKADDFVTFHPFFFHNCVSAFPIHCIERLEMRGRLTFSAAFLASTFVVFVLWWSLNTRIHNPPTHILFFFFFTYKH